MDSRLIGIVTGIRTLGLCSGAVLCHRIVNSLGQPPTVVGAKLASGLFVYFYSLAYSFESSLVLVFAEGFGAGIVSVTLVLLIPYHVPKNLPEALLDCFSLSCISWDLLARFQ